MISVDAPAPPRVFMFLSLPEIYSFSEEKYWLGPWNFPKLVSTGQEIHVG